MSTHPSEPAKRPQAPARAPAAPFTIAYDDEHLLVIDKAAGVVVHPAKGHREDTLSQLLAKTAAGAAGGDPERAGIVHRLDRDTSGALLLARTPGTAAKLAASFRGRDVEKTYWAVVARRPVPSEGRIDLPLRRIGGARG